MENFSKWVISLNYPPLKTVKGVYPLASNTVSHSLLVESEEQKFLFKLYPVEALTQLFGVSEQEIFFLIEYPLYFVEKISKGLFEVPHIVEIDQKRLFVFENFFVFFYKFADGKDLTINDYDLDQVKAIGKTLGHIHQVNFRSMNHLFWDYKEQLLKKFCQFYLNLYDKDKLKPFTLHQFGNEELIKFLDQTVEQIHSSKFLHFEYKDNLQEVVFTHYDIKPKNILWKNSKEFVVLDWETCMLMYQSTDFLRSLTAFSYVEDNTQFVLKEDQVKAFIQGYTQVVPQPITIQEKDLYILSFDLLNWLMNNLLKNNQAEVRYSLLYLDYLHKNFNYFKNLSYFN